MNRAGGTRTFAYLDPAGISSGQRWVRVTTADKGQYVCEWDALVQLAEEEEAG